MKKTVSVALTNRTNYSKLKLVLKELRNHEEVDLKIVVSSSILLDRYGSPYKDLEADGYSIDMKIDCVLMNDTHEAMAKTAGLSMIQHAGYFASIQPDMLLAVGDRFDIVSPVMAAAMMNIPIAHVQGGETSGTIDDRIRNVITKLSTLHFVSTNNCVERLESWGIEKNNILNFGCPAVEYITHLEVGDQFDVRRLHKKFKHQIELNIGEKYFLVMFHPDTTNEDDVYMNVILKAVDSFNVKTFIFYPNVDANNTKIVSDIAEYKNNKKFFMIRHMPLEDFIYTMAHASCMIGNSSSGIREAASFGVPVINVGERQKGRERNRNVLDVKCTYQDLYDAIQFAQNNKYERSNIYYKPDCSKRIAEKIVSYLNGTK